MVAIFCMRTARGHMRCIWSCCREAHRSFTDRLSLARQASRGSQQRSGVEGVEGAADAEALAPKRRDVQPPAVQTGLALVGFPKQRKAIRGNNQDVLFYTLSCERRAVAGCNGASKNSTVGSCCGVLEGAVAGCWRELLRGAVGSCCGVRVLEGAVAGCCRELLRGAGGSCCGVLEGAVVGCWRELLRGAGGSCCGVLEGGVA